MVLMHSYLIIGRRDNIITIVTDHSNYGQRS
jgi:hypothetical protein